MTVGDTSQTLKAKFHYAIWFEPAPNQLWNLALTVTYQVGLSSE